MLYLYGGATFEVGFISIMLSDKDTFIHQTCRKDAEHLFLTENACFVVLPGDLVTLPHFILQSVHES